MISRLWDDARAERGSYHSSGRSRTSARGRVIAQARAWKAAAVDVAAKAAHAGALRARAHTHSLTLQAKPERAGDVPSRGAHIHCARAHLLSIRSVWGGAGLQVLNVASRRTRKRIWRRFRKAQVLYRYAMYWQMHIYGLGTILHISCISDIVYS